MNIKLALKRIVRFSITDLFTGVFSVGIRSYSSGDPTRACAEFISLLQNKIVPYGNETLPDSAEIIHNFGGAGRLSISPPAYALENRDSFLLTMRLT